MHNFAVIKIINMTTKFLKNIIAVLFLNVTTVFVNGQTLQTGTLKGKIVDKITKQSLPGATIIIKGTQTNSVADTSGVFALKNVNEGIYSITISFIGYRDTPEI